MAKQRCATHRARAAALCAAWAWAGAAWAGPIGIGNSEPLTFGKFASGSGGSVFVDASGARSATGGVVLLSSTMGSAARFDVFGEPHLAYSISLPANGTSSLFSAGGHSMPLGDFTSSPAGTGLLNASGRQAVSIGARLNVAPNQPRGSYSGSFIIYVDYN